MYTLGGLRVELLADVFHHHPGSAFSDTVLRKKDTVATLEAFRRNPKGVRFSTCCRLCDEYFGKPRQKGTSHRVYRMPWPGEPGVNIQNDSGMAKAYRVRQVITAIERLEASK